MTKKKKKEKKKKLQDVKEDTEQIPEYSLDSAFHSAKTTETTLQTLLKGVSEGQGFLHPKRENSVKITPQLTHESRSKIAEAYVMEDIPLTQRAKIKEKPRTKLVSELKEETKLRSEKGQIETIGPASSPQATSDTVIKTPTKRVEVKPIEKAPTAPSTKEVPSFIKKESIYKKLTEFFEGLLTSYSESYDRWEMSISNILGILRKMRKITKKNTDDLTISITNIFKKIQVDLEQFKIKRDEIEKVAEVDIEEMSGEFKRVLGLLELQVKEYQLKRATDEIIHELKFLS
ncbi:MAG: hypothetical protein ACFE9Q_00380 [Candidatus Hodarchaeota archaeon]